MNEENREKMLNLLADRALFGLSDTELSELESLQKEFPESANDYSFDLTATAINLSNLDVDASLPSALEAEILIDAETYFAPLEARQRVADSEPKAEKIADERTAETVRQNYAPKRSFWSWGGWAIAAAACLILAVNLWTTRVSPPKQPEIVKNPETVETPLPAPSAEQARRQLLASANDVVQANWTEANPKTQNQISGDIVWSNSLQKGFMRFRGLPPNDPERETYQLWIADGTQDPKTPIDGGVFDVTESGEVVIPINAKLQVKKPKGFNVTKEKPGGVPVSKLEKVVAVAKI